MNLRDSTIFIMIGIAIIITLIVIAVNQSRILDAILKLNEKNKIQDDIKYEANEHPAVPNIERGKSVGQAKIVGDTDEETIAAIIAAVSSASNMPLSYFRITSIKRV